MHKLSADAELRDGISNNGKQLFADKYRIEKIAINYMNEILAIK
jgi:hypothetical protein